ncbi:MAG: hypothetical protein ACJAZS_000763 [Alteromonas naphthalenivorans]|jgi:hypothetical protein
MKKLLLILLISLSLSIASDCSKKTQRTFYVSDISILTHEREQNNLGDSERREQKLFAAQEARHEQRIGKGSKHTEDTLKDVATLLSKLFLIRGQVPRDTAKVYYY